MSLFENKTLMITGGAGGFGNAVSSEIRIFSRDEKKQDDMRHACQVKIPEDALPRFGKRHSIPKQRDSLGARESLCFCLLPGAPEPITQHGNIIINRSKGTEKISKTEVIENQGIVNTDIIYN